MSNSNSNRTKVLIGFGAVAVVVIAALAFWPPNYRSEDASGAIGVVQKHHAPQIAQKDVILGDEKTRTQQNVLYRNFFDDAVKLQSISAALVANQAGNAAQAASALRNELQNEYASAMQNALNQIEMNAKQQGNDELAQRAETLAAQVKGAQSLSAAEMQNFNAQFSKLSSAFQAKAANIEMMSKSLQSALGNDEQAASKLQAIAHELSQIEYASIQYASFGQYFQNIEAAASKLQSIEFANEGAASRMQEADALANEADALENAALHDIEAATASQVQAANALKDMEAALASSKLGAAQCCSSAIAELKNALNSAEQQFSKYASAAVHAELAEMAEFAASRAQYAKLANSPNLASMVANADMANKIYNKLAETDQVANVAQAMNKALDNRAYASMLADESALASQVEALASRSK